MSVSQIVHSINTVEEVKNETEQMGKAIRYTLEPSDIRLGSDEPYHVRFMNKLLRNDGRHRDL